MENNFKETDLIKQFQKMMEKSIKANTQIMAESAKTFSKILNQKTKLSDLQKLNKEVFNNTINHFMEINFQYAEKLIDLSLQLSKDVSSFVESLNKTESISPSKEVQKPSTPQKAELRLVGQAGETILSNFVLNNNSTKSKKGTFKVSRCKSIATAKATNIRIKFAPNHFTIAPNQKVAIEISASIPKSSKPGHYQSQVSIKGYDNSQFNVLIIVAAKNQ